MSRKLRIGHSPDPDDAFMFYGLATGGVRIRDFEVVHILEDIQSLNERAQRGDLEVTAISAHTYPFISNRYWILSCGASMGKGYGPILVCRGKVPSASLEILSGKKIAIPGKMTTAYLLSRIYLEKTLEYVEIPFDQILSSVLKGKVDGGLLIHEGQLTYEKLGLQRVIDFGELWQRDTNLPLPLGLDVVRSDLGETLAEEIRDGLRKSIQYAFDHEEEALTYALSVRQTGMSLPQAKVFVRMYVNEYTLDMGEEGRRGLVELFQRAVEKGIIPQIPELKII